jgi:DNA-binding beta-propeller fold protein YncE
MDMATAKFAATPQKGGVQGRILPAAWPTSPDAKRLYVGYSRYPDTRFYLDYDRSAISTPRTQTVNEIRVFDTTTWRSAGIIKTSASYFWTAASSNDGKVLYALAPVGHSVMVFDTTNLHQVRAIPVGGEPALALVAP